MHLEQQFSKCGAWPSSTSHLGNLAELHKARPQPAPRVGNSEWIPATSPPGDTETLNRGLCGARSNNAHRTSTGSGVDSALNSGIELAQGCTSQLPSLSYHCLLSLGTTHPTEEPPSRRKGRVDARNAQTVGLAALDMGGLYWTKWHQVRMSVWGP